MLERTIVMEDKQDNLGKEKQAKHMQTREQYETPAIVTYDGADLLKALGPAHTIRGKIFARIPAS